MSRLHTGARRCGRRGNIVAVLRKNGRRNNRQGINMKLIPRVPKHLRTGVVGTILLGSALVTGCASVPVPKEQLAVTEAAVNDAVRSGAPQYAPAELKTAQDKLERAREAVDDREYERAEVLAAEAEMDAKVAEARANSSKVQQAANQVQRSLDALRQELKLEQ